MITIAEYLLGKTTKRGGPDTIIANDDNVKQIVDDEMKKLGWEADLNHIDTSQVTDMSGLFRLGPFCGDISEWDVSNVEYMNSMFNGAIYFNGDLSKWDVSKVRSMKNMFAAASKFEGHGLRNWKPESVTTSSKMFMDARMFNEDISSWKMPNNRDYEKMFSKAKAFKQDLSKWKISPYACTTEMFYDSGMSRNKKLQPQKDYYETID